MMFRRFLWLGGSALTGAVLLSGCGNAVPTVDAGPDRPAAIDRVFTFNPTASDEDGDPLTFAWVLTRTPTKSEAKLKDPNIGRASFTPDLPGKYGFSVTVSDEVDTSSPDTITITARFAPELRLSAVAVDEMGTVRELDKAVAAAKPVIAINPGERLDFNAATSTTSTGEMDFEWAVEPPDKIEYETKDTDTSTFTFTVANAKLGPTADKMEVDPESATYKVSLTVGDSGRDEKGNLNEDLTTTKDMTVHVRAAPTVKISTTPDSQVVKLGMEGKEVILDGSGSEVGPGGKAKYEWTIANFPMGSMVSFADAKVATTTVTLDVEGSYEFELEVSDGAFSSKGSVTIQAVP